MVIILLRIFSGLATGVYQDLIEQRILKRKNIIKSLGTINTKLGIIKYYYYYY